jgi:hypothetical protein
MRSFFAPLPVTSFSCLLALVLSFLGVSVCAPVSVRCSQVVNNLKAGVVEPAMSKVKSLRFATEAAITILRIDDFIKINPPRQGPQ